MDTFVSLFIAAVVVVGIYLFTRAFSRGAAAYDDTDAATFELPAIGKPGTATNPQRRAAIAVGIPKEIADQLSAEQIHMVLSARNYAEAVLDRYWDDDADETDQQYDDVKAAVTIFILKDAALREHVTAWSDREYRARRDTPRLSRGEHHDQIVEFYRAFLSV